MMQEHQVKKLMNGNYQSFIIHKSSMTKVPHAGKDHGDVVLIGGGNDFKIVFNTVHRVACFDKALENMEQFFNVRKM